MAYKNFRKKIAEKLHNKYRLIIYNDTTFQSVWTLKLTRLKLFTFLCLFSAFMIFLVLFLVASTPLKEYIPGYPKAEYREMLLRNVLLIDSLEKELNTRDHFFNDLKTILSGEIPDTVARSSEIPGKNTKIPPPPLNSDSVFQDKIIEERVNLSVHSNREQAGSPERIHFFIPLKGVITNKFDPQKGHYGVDIVSKPNSRISAALGGTVLFSGWTSDTGHVIYLQHQNNLVSTYKHNAELLKKAGDQVKAGEAIAIIGNTGGLSTGPHLHFELWYNGKALDPEKYMVF